MKFENTGLENKTVEQSRLNEVMTNLGFVLAGQWDYERVTYDRKFESKGDVFYLRVQGFAVEGEIDTRHAIVRLLTPILGKHYYPHGVEYGDGEIFPTTVVDQSKRLLNELANEINKLQ